ncbi:MAG: PilX N-terminal domain-containing pilus assembly protein, partial [Gammaproteobacteria bacterium]
MSYRIKNCNYRQRGAALITALVMLTIMTLLAISSMSTNTLEEKMASNAQQVERAFHTAETGLQMVLADNNAFDTNNNVNNNNTPFNMSDDVYDYGANADGQRD